MNILEKCALLTGVEKQKSKYIQGVNTDATEKSSLLNLKTDFKNTDLGAEPGMPR